MLQEELKDAAMQRAKSVLGLDQYPMLLALEERVNSIVADFTAGAEWLESQPFNQVIKLNPESDKLYEVFGVSEARLHEIDEAISEVLHVAQAAPEISLIDILIPCTKIPQSMSEAFMIGYLAFLPITDAIEMAKRRHTQNGLILPHHYSK